MTRFMRELNGEFGEYWYKSAMKDIERMCKHYLEGDIDLTDGVARWKSNNHVLPEDCCEMLAQRVAGVNLAACDKARKIDDEKFFAEYRKAMENYVPSEEEMCEMRAAFGEGEVVVDVITGRKYYL